MPRHARNLVAVVKVPRASLPMCYTTWQALGSAQSRSARFATTPSVTLASIAREDVELAIVELLHHLCVLDSNSHRSLSYPCRVTLIFSRFSLSVQPS